MGRLEKVEHAVQRELSLILHDELKDPRLGFLTIVQVEMSPDLRVAKIYYSVLGGDAEYARTKKALESAGGFLRTNLAQRINLRFAPELIFREDRSQEYSIRVQQILDEIGRKDEPVKRRRRNTKA